MSKRRARPKATAAAPAPSVAPRRRRPIAAIGLALVGSIALAIAVVVGGRAWLDREPAVADPVAAAASARQLLPTLRYVGSGACAGCHADETARWKASDHFHAMAEPTAQTVLGDFNDAKFTYNGVT